METIEFSNTKCEIKNKSGLLYFDKKKKLVKDEMSDPNSLLRRVCEKWSSSINPIRNMLKNGSYWNDVRAMYCNMSVFDFLRANDWSDELVRGFAK